MIANVSTNVLAGSIIIIIIIFIIYKYYWSSDDIQNDDTSDNFINISPTYKKETTPAANHTNERIRDIWVPDEDLNNAIRLGNNEASLDNIKSKFDPSIMMDEITIPEVLFEERLSLLV